MSPLSKDETSRGMLVGSPFTLTLANIFMWHWEEKLVEQQIASNELYGRQAVVHRVYHFFLLISRYHFLSNLDILMIYS